MPKASAAKKTRFAPYVPLHKKKVLIHLTGEDEQQDDLLLRETVERLGGTVVGIKHNIDYIVARKQGDKFCLSEALDDFVWRNGYLEERVVTPGDMFTTLNEMMAATMPVDCQIVTFKNVAYPIRMPQYTELGRTLELNVTAWLLECLATKLDLACSPELDIVAMKQHKNEKDAWNLTFLHRYQICKNEATMSYVVLTVETGLWWAVHERKRSCDEVLLNSERTENAADGTVTHKYQFDTLEQAKAHVSTTWTKRLFKVECDDVTVGMKGKSEDQNYSTEVLQTWQPGTAQPSR